MGAVSLPAASTVVVAALAALVIVIADGAVWRRRVALFLALFAAGSALQVHVGARLQSDGFYYYAFARSIWFDRDVDLTNDYRLLGLDDAQHRHLFTPTLTGHAQTTWAIGPALLWSPFLAAGHASAVWLGTRRTDVAADGTSFPYRQAACLAGLFYGLVGLFLCHAVARERFGAWLSLGATIGVGAGSFVLWYLVREPTMSHSVSMAAVALVVWGWLRVSPASPVRAWALLGLAGGVMMAVRWQNAIVLLLPAWTLAEGFWRAERGAARLAVVARGGTFAAAAIVGFLPQMIAWQAIYGQFLARSPIAPQMFWTAPEIVDLLWSSRNGLFATSPAIYLSVIGLFVLSRRDWRLSVAGLGVFALMVWTNGAVEDWYGGAGFGGRRFDSLVPFFTLGLAAFMAAFTPAVGRHPGRAAAALLGLLVVWNVTLVGVARSGMYRIGQPVSFGEIGAAQAGLLHDWVGHPPSMPANLLYAAANRVAPGRYDLLGPNRFLGDPTRQYGRVDVGSDDLVFVDSGWHAPERSGEVTFRWATRTAGLFVPLDHAADLLVQIRVLPFDSSAAAPQTLTLIVNGEAASPVVLSPDWQVAEIPAPRAWWRAGVNRVTLVFARDTRPVDVGPSTDGRALAGAVDYLRVWVTAAR